MVVFLTSSFLYYQDTCDYTPKPLRTEHQFIENINRFWKPDANVLVFSSDPSDPLLSDHLAREFCDAFTLSGFSFGEIRIFDYRTVEEYKTENNHANLNFGKEALKEALLWADVFYLAGGHAPTENNFMNSCELKSLIHNPDIFDGLFIGLSAGSMNAATEVYLAPEKDGESVDPGFSRTATGLGLTSLQILPHSQYMKTITLDGKDYIDEIIRKDSLGRRLYLIPDGTYFMIRNGVTELFGECEIMENGNLYPLHTNIINDDHYLMQTNEKNAIKENIRLFHSFISSYYDWVLEMNIETNAIAFHHVSNRFIEKGLVPIFIHTLDELLSLFSEKFVVDEEKQAVLDQLTIEHFLQDLSQKGSFVRTVHIYADHCIHAMNFRVNHIEGEQNKILICLVDISMILDHDWMTDEYSRTGFLSNASSLLKQGKIGEGYSLVYTNIQGFKAINDLLGTVNGDMVIFKERDVLVKELNPILVARLESDHFVLITETSNITPQKMEKVCRQEYTDDSKKISILIQCGVYHITDTSRTVSYMLDQAKLAEKSIVSGLGIPYAISNEKLSTEYMNQRRFIADVDHALQNREFLTYYQPIVDAKSYEIVSAEALIRWNHHEKGMVPPYQFIPVFEKEGIISKIDSYMIDNVLQFNLKRIQQGKSIIPCAVNLSRVDFYDTKLLEVITSTLKKYQNIQNILKLEVTESAYAVLESDAIAFLQEMKKLGLSILLDDFGSGMSSLSTLESFAFDYIKLDLGFTAKIGKSLKSEAIIKNTIGLSHDLGAKVIAEGVEYKEQLAFLQAAGCDFIQGYYFYKPMPEQDFHDLLP